MQGGSCAIETEEALRREACLTPPRTQVTPLTIIMLFGVPEV